MRGRERKEGIRKKRGWKRERRERRERKRREREGDKWWESEREGWKVKEWERKGKREGERERAREREIGTVRLDELFINREHCYKIVKYVTTKLILLLCH